MTSAADATRLWTFRGRAERMAAARFEQLLRDHDRLGGHAEVRRLLVKAVADEHRHAEQCAALVEALGGDGTPAPRRPVPATPVLGRLPPATVLTIQIVGMCALNETVSAAALSAMLKAARGGPAHATIRAILKDEIDHARIGWAHLEDESRRGRLDGEAVAAAMPRLLREAVEDELFETGEVEPAADDDALRSLGGLNRATRRALFVEAVEGLVIPGLTRVGIGDASTRRWLSEMSR